MERGILYLLTRGMRNRLLEVAASGKHLVRRITLRRMGPVSPRSFYLSSDPCLHSVPLIKRGYRWAAKTNVINGQAINLGSSLGPCFPTNGRSVSCAVRNSSSGSRIGGTRWRVNVRACTVRWTQRKNKRSDSIAMRRARMAAPFCPIPYKGFGLKSARRWQEEEEKGGERGSVGAKEQERAVVEGWRSRRVQGQRSGFLGSLRDEVRKGCCARRMWNSRSAHSVTPATAYPSSVHTP